MVVKFVSFSGTKKPDKTGGIAQIVDLRSIEKNALNDEVDMSESGTKREGVDAVERALAILAAFSEQAQELSLAELARRTGLYKSTILRLAASLEHTRFLTRGSDGTCRLGPELWRLGSLYRRSFDLGEYVRPTLRALVEATQETASFYIRDGDQRICLYRLNSPRSARHHLDEGVRLPLGRGAAGRVLLAFTERGDSSLQAIRDAGLVVSRGERDPEVAAVSAPVIDSAGHLRGALSLSTLMSRFDEAAERKLVEAIAPAAKQLAARLPAE